MTDAETPTDAPILAAPAEAERTVPHHAELRDRLVVPRSLRTLWAAWVALLVLLLAVGCIAALALFPGMAARLPTGWRPANAQTDLGSRLATNESRMAALRQEVEALARRVEEVERKQQSAPAGIDPAALDTVSTRVQALDQRVAGLESNLQSVQAGARQEQDLEDRIGKLEARVEAIASDQRKAAEADRRAGFALALASLDTAVQAGTPYAGQLDAIRHLGAPDSAITVLAGHATEGIPTGAALARRFPGLADQVVRAERLSPSANWLERAWARLRGLIVARPVGDTAGTDTPAILARAQSRLDAGDLAGAVKQVSSLSGSAADTLVSWRADAQARLEAEAELARLRAGLLDYAAGRG